MLRRIQPALLGFPLASSSPPCSKFNRNSILEHICSAMAVTKNVAASGLEYAFLSLCHTPTGTAGRVILYSPIVIARDVGNEIHDLIVDALY